MNYSYLAWQEAERQKQEAEQQQEDEEGWVKVTKSSRGMKVRPHSETANERTLQKEKKKKERKELLNFYTWQHRNTQKERESRDDHHHNHARVKTEIACDESAL